VGAESVAGGNQDLVAAAASAIAPEAAHTFEVVQYNPVSSGGPSAAPAAVLERIFADLDDAELPLELGGNIAFGLESQPAHSASAAARDLAFAWQVDATANEGWMADNLAASPDDLAQPSWWSLMRDIFEDVGLEELEAIWVD
jgi:hypothetical protein